MTALKKLSTALLAGVLACGATPALSQVSGKAFQGFGSGSKDPIKIDADKLEVLDELGQLTYSGNVKVVQGTSVLTAGKLVIEYDKGKSGGQNDLKKLTFTGNMVATSEDNTATADGGTYDPKTEIVVLNGNVVVSQGPNVAKGCKLVANLKTNKAQLDSCGGRVQSVFTPGSNDN